MGSHNALQPIIETSEPLNDHGPTSPSLSTRAKPTDLLVAGAGGGLDVFAGLPIHQRLRSLGKEVFLANLSCTYLGGTDARMLCPGLYEVEPTTQGEDTYFPERALARFLSRKSEPATIYAFEKLGVKPIRAAYRQLVDLHKIDAIVLIDGGTDILVRGDEASLGTPEEDMTSLAAVAGISVPTRLVTCVGFGIDTFHRIYHANWLENVAALTRSGAFLGASALLSTMPEVKFYFDAVNAGDMATSRRPSIVNGSIVSAITGHFGGLPSQLVHQWEPALHQSSHDYLVVV